MKGKQKVYVWAVDPFVEDLGPQKETAQALSELTNGRPVTIQPVYLYSPKLFGTPMVIPETLHHKIEAEGRQKIGSLVESVGIEGVEPLEVVSRPFTRLKDGVKLLVEHARSLGAELIALGTYARRGARRWLVGSFAEAMTEISDIPLLVLNPEWGHRTDFSRILFATDFSEESHRAFQQVIAFAAERGAGISLFHKVNFGLAPGFDVAFGSYPSYPLLFDQEVRDRKELAEEWLDEADKSGVKGEANVDSTSIVSVAQAILDEADRRPSLIALASQSGPIERVLLGSATRKIVRDAKDPVWIVHPSSQGASQRLTRNQVA